MHHAAATEHVELQGQVLDRLDIQDPLQEEAEGARGEALQIGGRENVLRREPGLQVVMGGRALQNAFGWPETIAVLAEADQLQAGREGRGEGGRWKGEGGRGKAEGGGRIDDG